MLSIKKMCENTPDGAENTSKRGQLVRKIRTNLKKQSQFARLWPEVRKNTFYRVRFEKTKPISGGCKWAQAQL